LAKGFSLKGILPEGQTLNRIILEKRSGLRRTLKKHTKLATPNPSKRPGKPKTELIGIFY